MKQKANKLPRLYFAFANEGNRHQVYLYDDITETGKFNWETWSYEESETSASHFQELLNEIPATEEIELFINSNGGSVKEGTAIYNQLKRHPAKKTGRIDGVGHSIAFTILQACDWRVMGEGTSALLHNPWTATAGNADELRAEAERMDALTNASVALLMQRASGITEPELRNLMKKETMLTPDEALKYGFIDEIEGRKQQEDTDEQAGPSQAAANIKRLRNKFRGEQFDGVIKEFESLVKNQEEPENEASMMDAFFNIFS